MKVMTFAFTCVRSRGSAQQVKRMISVVFGRSWTRLDLRMASMRGRFAFCTGEMGRRYSIKYTHRKGCQLVRMRHFSTEWGLRRDETSGERGTRPCGSPLDFSKPRRRFLQKFHVCSSFPGRVPRRKLIFGFEPYRFVHSSKES